MDSSKSNATFNDSILYSDVLQMINDNAKESLRKLDDIWRVMGFDENIRNQRSLNVVKYVDDFFLEMLQDADSQMFTLINKIEVSVKKLKHITNELQINDTDSYSYTDVPLYQVEKKLENKYEEYQKIYDTRMKLVEELTSQAQDICSVLGKKPKSLSTSPLPSESELIEYRNNLDDLANEKYIRTETFLKTQADLRRIVHELNIKPSLYFERHVLYDDETQFEVTDDNMIKLDKFYTTLKNQLSEMHAKIADLRQQLHTLWDRLDEPMSVREAFLKNYSQDNLATLNALREEFARCEQKKIENMKKIIDKTRKELIHWWDMALYSEDEINQFPYIHSDCYNEDLLSLHEIQIEIVRNHYVQNKTIFELFKKHGELFMKLKELERRGTEPDRFKNRGGQLLREEKERKAVANNLPKIEAELLELADNYHLLHGFKFKIRGETLDEIFSKLWKDYKENKHNVLCVKKQARDQTMRTPMKSPKLTSSAALTPYTTPAKRKLRTSVVGSSKKENTPPKKKIPKLQVNGSTVKRASIERKKRMERKPKSPPKSKGKSGADQSTIIDYEIFELQIREPTNSRSTLAAKTDTNDNIKCKSSKTPRKELRSCRTPQSSLKKTRRRPVCESESEDAEVVSQRITPRQMKLRAKSPAGLPIIF